MKTRVIYPSLWDQDEVLELSKDGKVLIFNLLTTSCLGLTRYLKLGDIKVCSETGLNKSELKKAQQEVVACKIYHFDGWYYLGCDFSYLDYEGRDRVMEAKQKELTNVPNEIFSYFERVSKGLETPYEEVKENESDIDNFKGLETGCKPVLNPKPKTINHKLGVVKGIFSSLEDLTDEVCQLVADENSISLSDAKKVKKAIKLYCEAHGKRYKNYKSVLISWVLSDIDKGKIKVVKKEIYEPVVEYDQETIDLIQMGRVTL